MTITHATVLQAVAAYWDNPPWTPEGQAMFLGAIRPHNPENLLAAAKHFYATDTKGFRPTAGQLISLVKNPDPEASERGWQAFLRAVYHYAGKPTHEVVYMPSFADERVSQAVEAIGGFAQFLGGIPSKELDYLKARFLKAYACTQDARLALPAGKDTPALPRAADELIGRLAKGMSL